MENKIKFEEAMILLEQSVSKLESGSLGLDDAIAEYERAVGLVKYVTNDSSTQSRGYDF